MKIEGVMVWIKCEEKHMKIGGAFPQQRPTFHHEKAFANYLSCSKCHGTGSYQMVMPLDEFVEYLKEKELI